MRRSSTCRNCRCSTSRLSSSSVTPFPLLDAFGAATETISELPAVSESMVALFGISHTGYLAGKSLPHGKSAPAAPKP